MTAGVDESPQPVARFRFESGGPNPFSGATQLAYTLPERGRVRLAVYDLAGREVALLTAGMREPGINRETWDGRGSRGAELPAGVYFARLEFAGAVETAKIVLAR